MVGLQKYEGGRVKCREDLGRMYRKDMELLGVGAMN